MPGEMELLPGKSAQEMFLAWSSCQLGGAGNFFFHMTELTVMCDGNDLHWFWW